MILPHGAATPPSGTAHKTGNAGSSPASPSRSVVMRACCSGFIFDYPRKGESAIATNRTYYYSLTITGRTILSGVFYRSERSPHPRTRFNRRRRDVASPIEHHPQLRIQVAAPPCFRNFL